MAARLQKSHKSTFASKTVPLPSLLAPVKRHIPKLESETKTLPILFIRGAFFCVQTDCLPRDNV
jgi:hypothetical protein